MSSGRHCTNVYPPALKSAGMEVAAEDSARCATPGGDTCTAPCPGPHKGLVAKRKEWCRTILARQQWRDGFPALGPGNFKLTITDAA